MESHWLENFFASTSTQGKQMLKKWAQISKFVEEKEQGMACILNDKQYSVTSLITKEAITCFESERDLSFESLSGANIVIKEAEKSSVKSEFFIIRSHVWENNLLKDKNSDRMILVVTAFDSCGDVTSKIAGELPLIDRVFSKQMQRIRKIEEFFTGIKIKLCHRPKIDCQITKNLHGVSNISPMEDWGESPMVLIESDDKRSQSQSQMDWFPSAFSGFTPLLDLATSDDSGVNEEKTRENQPESRDKNEDAETQHIQDTISNDKSEEYGSRDLLRDGDNDSYNKSNDTTTLNDSSTVVYMNTKMENKTPYVLEQFLTSQFLNSAQNDDAEKYTDFKLDETEGDIVCNDGGNSTSNLEININASSDTNAFNNSKNSCGESEEKHGQSENAECDSNKSNEEKPHRNVYKLRSNTWSKKKGNARRKKKDNDSIFTSDNDKVNDNNNSNSQQKQRSEIMSENNNVKQQDRTNDTHRSSGQVEHNKGRRNIIMETNNISQQEGNTCKESYKRICEHNDNQMCWECFEKVSCFLPVPRALTKLAAKTSCPDCCCTTELGTQPR